MKKLRCILLTFLILTAGRAFALEEYVTNVYHEIDTAFQQKSESELNVVLQENQGDRYYYLMENYATKKVRRLIITNDYEFAMNAILVIIDNNLENTDAVEMYAMISDAFEEKRAAELEAQMEKERQLAKLEASKESQRANVEKTYNTVETASGKKVFMEKDLKLSHDVWKARFGLVDGAIVMDAGTSFTDFKFGISGAYDYEHQSNNINWGVDALAGFNFSFLQPSVDNTILANVDVQGKISFTSLWDRFFLRGGLLALPAMQNKGTSAKPIPIANVQGTFFSPTVGIALSNVPVGNAELTMTADYYPGHLFYKDLTAAAGFGLNFAIPYAELETLNLTFNIGVKDYLFIKNTGIENRAKIIIAIGAENVIR